MAFRFKADESVEEGVKRILREQIARARKELSDPERNTHESVHQVRKRCKKVRAIYRLVRPEVPKVYRRENARFRDMARDLSAVRDAEAMLESYDALMARFEKEIKQRTDFANIRRRLVLRRNSMAGDTRKLAGEVKKLRSELKGAEAAINSWSLPSSGFAAVKRGFEKTYRRARKAMVAVLSEPSSAGFHEWRKRAKHHRLHVRILRNVWPEVFSPLEKEIARLGEYLGDEHDLAVLARVLREERAGYWKSADVHTFLEMIEIRRGELQKQAELLGRRVYSAKPGGMRGRLKDYWKAWRDEQRGFAPSRGYSAPQCSPGTRGLRTFAAEAGGVGSSAAGSSNPTGLS